MIADAELVDGIVACSEGRLQFVDVSGQNLFRVMIDRVVHVLYGNSDCACNKHLKIKVDKLFSPDEELPPWIYAILEQDNLSPANFSLFTIKRLIRSHAGDISFYGDDALWAENVISTFIFQVVTDMIDKNEDQILSGARLLTGEHIIDYLQNRGGYSYTGFDKKPFGPLTLSIPPNFEEEMRDIGDRFIDMVQRHSAIERYADQAYSGKRCSYSGKRCNGL